ncbi:pyridoxamine 5'-phosphate oxidase family protein [Nonomuraea pusilla]|uniref:pyridoxamine 5'-phosphate oxidase family protein n=1 Tax=Nonomuraea pusilla TaxID=46177 RepID=UPI003320CE21
MTPPPRSAEQRKQDTLRRLRHDVDAWVATAGDESPYLVPLSFLWDGETLLLSTATASPTARNLLKTGRTRICVGLTRDVVLVEGTAEAVPDTEIDQATGDAFAAACGFDPRASKAPYHYFRVRPVLIQAWREADELEGRDVMRDGRWIVPD